MREMQMIRAVPFSPWRLDCGKRSRCLANIYLLLVHVFSAVVRSLNTTILNQDRRNEVSALFYG